MHVLSEVLSAPVFQMIGAVAQVAFQRQCAILYRLGFWNRLALLKSEWGATLGQPGMEFSNSTGTRHNQVGFL